MALPAPTLLYKDFTYRGMKYDVYGLPATEDDECWIDFVYLAGTKVDVKPNMTKYDVEMLAYWVGEERRMDRLAELREARVEQAIYEREVRKSDRQWRSL